MNDPNQILSAPGDDFTPLLPFYVYVLIDPRDSSVFYVGKGQGNRILNHVAEVRFLLSRTLAPEREKHQRIHDIFKADKEPLELIIGRYESEQEAFAVESTLINFVYDFSTLTNLSRGHGAEYIRTKGCIGRIEGIDLPKPVRVNDGSFRNAQVAGLSAGGAYDFMNTLQQDLSERGFAWRDFSAPADRPFLPGEANGILAVLVHVAGIDFMVSFSKKCQPAVCIANTPATRNETSSLALQKIHRLMGNDFESGPAKNIRVHGEGRYRDFVRKFRSRNAGTREALELLQRIRAHFDDVADYAATSLVPA